MPELPDVEVMRQYLQSTSLHQEIRLVQVLTASVVKGSSPDAFSASVRGKSFVETGRHGKHLFVMLDDGSWITMHFGMTGNLYYYPVSAKTPFYARVLFLFNNDHALAYNDQRKFGKIDRISSPGEFVSSLHLGIDALDRALDSSRFRKILSNRKGVIKAVLMDQHEIAGIGNVYSDEILFQARIHPAAPVNSLSREQIQTLYSVMKKVLETAIRAKADPSRMPESFLLPVRKSGDICPGCEGEQKVKKIAGRSSVFCPQCQRMP